MQGSYLPPEFEKTSFHCPNCGVLAKQIWCAVIFRNHNYGYNGIDEDVKFAVCMHCERKSIWLSGKMINPTTGTVSLPNLDLPEDIRKDYEEARDILNMSPRGSAALLRLAVQKLCKHLGEKGDNINDDIKNLVKKGLSPMIQQSLDIVRVIGNNAVHPGQIDLTDDHATATSLFNLLNVIADAMITQPKNIHLLYNSLPQDKLEQIARRDKQAGID